MNKNNVLRFLQKFGLILLIFYHVADTFGQNDQNSDRLSTQSINDLKGFPAAGTPSNPKVMISWNRYYDYDGIVKICQSIAEAYPRFVKYGIIGKSYEGKDIPILTIAYLSENESDLDRPGYYMDGNIHSNEIQASEVCMYTAWYLAEMFDQNDFIHILLKEKVFYIVPTINPDGRNYFMNQPNTPHSPRSGVFPFDDDRDGLADEDPYDDLDGDGNITLMRRKSPVGRYKLHPDDPRILIPAKPGEQGQYEILGYEGKDQDGDGLVNEDNVGFYDPNRDWSFGWQPRYIQHGSGIRPFLQPENRAVREFVYQHPNIAGSITYHNTGGMFLRGPSNTHDKSFYSSADVEIYNQFGKKGEEMLPGYRYINTFEDLYQVYGGESDWFHGVRGVISMTGELYTPYLMNHKKTTEYIAEETEFAVFDKSLMFNDGFADWVPYNHPNYGKIEIGGIKKNALRINPGFLLESDAHRNAAFAIYHAFQTPKLEILEPEIINLGENIFQITVKIANRRITPTHIEHDINYKIEIPDYITLKDAVVISSFEVLNADLNISREVIHRDKSSIPFANIPGNGYVTARWIIQGGGDLQINLKSKKGGKISKNIKVY